MCGARGDSPTAVRGVSFLLAFFSRKEEIFGRNAAGEVSRAMFFLLETISRGGLGRKEGEGHRFAAGRCG